MWTHKVTREQFGDGPYYQIREFYGIGTDREAHTRDAITPGGPSIDELIWELRMMLKTAKRAKRDPSYVFDMPTENKTNE